MADVSLLPVVDATEVRIGHVPEGAGQVFFPVLNAVLVFVTGILTSSGIGFAGIQHAVEIGVFLAVVKGVAVGVVVSRVAGLSRIAVGAVDLNAVADAVAVGVGRGRVGQQRERLVGVVETVPVGVCTLGVGGRDAVNLSGEGGATARTDALNRVARRGGLRDDAVGTVAETRRGTAHRGPRWVHVLQEVVQAVAVGVAVGPVSVGR